MSTRETERDLTALLHRHAEDAMSNTDTQAEHERFQDVLETGPRTGRPTRRLLVLAGTVAAAGVVAAAVLTLEQGDDSTGTTAAENPASGGVAQQEREAEILADRVVAAYAAGDASAVTSSLSGARSWPGAMRHMERDRAWSVEYLLEPCKARSTYTNGVLVECVSDMHLLHSAEVGAGPFEASGVFSVMVRDGRVFNGTTDYDVETGMGDHLDDVFAWVEENHPEEVKLLFADELDVPAGKWDRWTLLWQQYAAEYAAQTTSESTG